MPRKAVWPPQPRPHANGQDRVKVAGKSYYLGRTGTPEAAAAYAALLERLTLERDSPPPKPAPFTAPTVAEAVAHWVREKLPTLDARAQYRYSRALSVLVRVAGAVVAARFDAGQLDRVRAAMLDGSWLLAGERGHHGLRTNFVRNSKGGGKWSPRTANRMVGAVKTIWRWLELRSHTPPGSWGALRVLPPLPCPSRRRREYSTADVIKVAVAMPRSPARRMLLVQLWSGARSGEIRGMLWSEIDCSGPVWMWRPSRHKNAWRGHERCIALGPRAQAVLRQQRRKEPRSALVFPCRVRGRGRVTGEYTASAYARCVAVAAAKCGLAGLHPYAARHAARMRVSRALGLEAARSMMGHRGADVTAGYGSPVDAQLAERAALRAG